MQEPDLPETILPDEDVTYTLVEKGTERGALKLVSSDGYTYTKKSTKGNFTYWRCAKRSAQFQQLWSIHAFIRSGECTKQIPLVFVLMSRRKTCDYVAISSISNRS